MVILPVATVFALGSGHRMIPSASIAAPAPPKRRLACSTSAPNPTGDSWRWAAGLGTPLCSSPKCDRGLEGGPLTSCPSSAAGAGGVARASERSSETGRHQRPPDHSAAAAEPRLPGHQTEWPKAEPSPGGHLEAQATVIQDLVAGYHSHPLRPMLGRESDTFAAAERLRRLPRQLGGSGPVPGGHVRVLLRCLLLGSGASGRTWPLAVGFSGTGV